MKRIPRCDLTGQGEHSKKTSGVHMGFSRQEYWSGVPFSIPGDLPDPGIELLSLVSTALAGGFFTTAPPIYRGVGGWVCVCV